MEYEGFAQKIGEKMNSAQKLEKDEGYSLFFIMSGLVLGLYPGLKLPAIVVITIGVVILIYVANKRKTTAPEATPAAKAT